MKRFRFTLRSVQTVRNIRELRAREVFSAAVAAQAQAARALEAAQLRIQELETIMTEARSQTFRPAEQVAYIHEYALVRKAGELAAQELAKAVQHMEQCRELWIASRRDVRVIEKLETKAREQHRQECEHEEQSLMDDRVNALVGRAPLILS
jgi:flagellar export protein FliJ